MKSVLGLTIIIGIIFLSSCTESKTSSAESKTVSTEKKTAILIFEEDSPSRSFVGHENKNDFHLYFIDFKTGDCKVFADAKLSSELKLYENNTQLSGECDEHTSELQSRLHLVC